MYLPQGLYTGGLGSKIGNSASGSPMMLRMIRNLSGSSPTTGLTLSATGLYFFFVFFFSVGVIVMYDGSDETLPVLEGWLTVEGVVDPRNATLDLAVISFANRFAWSSDG